MRRQHHQQIHNQLLNRNRDGGDNPYQLHQELGNLMTKVATVVRHNKNLQEAYDTVSEMKNGAARCSISDTGQWTNQNVVFTKALIDMFPVAQAILLGALQRDECRGAHFKPEFAPEGIQADEPAERTRQAEQWCDDFEANNERWLKSTIATWNRGSSGPDVRGSRYESDSAPTAIVWPARWGDH